MQVIADAVAGGGGGMSHLLIFGLIFLGMWFLMIAPGRKRQKQHQQMLSQLRSGNRILLLSGIIGKVTQVSGGHLKVEIAKGVRIDVLRSAVQQLLEAESADTDGNATEGEKNAEETAEQPAATTNSAPRRGRARRDTSKKSGR
jgi:preprotein translocase subunit YajC